MKILVLSHDCDLVLYRMLVSLNDDEAFDITVAGPETDRPKVPDSISFESAAAIKSKFTFRAIRDVRRLLRQGGYDAVFAVSTSALSTALFASIGIRVKIVGYRGTQARVRPLDPTYYMALLNPRVDHIVCETPDIEQYLSRYIAPRKLSTKTKPYDLAWVVEAEADPVSYPSDVLQLVYIGISKGRPHKGLEHLLEAMRLLGDKAVHLTVVGNAEQAAIDSAPGNVTFTGNRPDALRYLPRADIFVLSSTRDASPRVVREAQACGVPCIVSDIPGARDLIIDGTTGVLVEPANPQAIADAVLRLASDTDLRKKMGIAAKEHIRRNFRTEDYVDYFKKTFLALK